MNLKLADGLLGLVRRGQESFEQFRTYLFFKSWVEVGDKKGLHILIMKINK